MVYLDRVVREEEKISKFLQYRDNGDPLPTTGTSAYVSVISQSYIR